MSREGYSLNSLAELRAIPPSLRSAKSVYRVAPKNRWYGFVPDSTAQDDGDSVIAPNVGSGRWEAMDRSDGGNSGGNNGGGGEDGGSSELADRVTALEFQVADLNEGSEQAVNWLQQQIDWLSSGVSSLEFWLEHRLARALGELLIRVIESRDFFGSYDSDSDRTTVTLSINLRQLCLEFRVLNNTGNLVKIVPESIEYRFDDDEVVIVFVGEVTYGFVTLLTTTENMTDFENLAESAIEIASQRD